MLIENLSKYSYDAVEYQFRMFNRRLALTVGAARGQAARGQRAREGRRRAARRRGARLVVRAPAVVEARAQPREQRRLGRRLGRHQSTVQVYIIITIFIYRLYNLSK